MRIKKCRFGYRVPLSVHPTVNFKDLAAGGHTRNMSDPNTVVRKRRGRPREPDFPITSFRLDPRWRQDIDEWRRGEPDNLSRSQAIRDLIMRGLLSKGWQDFWMFVVLAVSYGFTIWCFRLLRRHDVLDDKKGIAVMVVVLWIIVIPITMAALGAGPELWKTFSAPFR
jgi:hypothetical protein